MADYKKLTPSGPRQLTPEMQSALDDVDKPAKRGKKPESKKTKTEGPSSRKKRKADKAAPSAPKKKKLKKMVKRPKVPSPTDSNEEKQSAEEEEEVQHEGSPRGNTLPRSPTPQVQHDVRTPPPSPKETTVPISVAPIPPPVTSQPITTTPLPPLVFSQATTTTTTTTGPSVSVNVSDTGAYTINISTPVTTKPPSPTSSTDSEPILGGANFEFDSNYYIPYRLPSEDDDEALVTNVESDSGCYGAGGRSVTRGEAQNPPTLSKIIIQTEPKVNVASGSGREKLKDVVNDDDDDEEEKIAEALKRKKRDNEIDENLRIARAEEEKE
ncbi:hypothetical protein Lser_V15G22324 [Lactuca serriola]